MVLFRITRFCLNNLPIAKPAATSMNLTRIVKTKKMVAKFQRKVKEKKKVDQNAEAPYTRFQRLTHKRIFHK